jgi:hypothetical protein
MRHFAGIIRSLVGLAVLGVALLAIHYFLGHDPGGPCAQDFECRYAWNGACLHGSGVDPYCSRTCATNADCPATWTCEAIETEVIAHGVRSVNKGELACVRPTPKSAP